MYVNLDDKWSQITEKEANKWIIRQCLHPEHNPPGLICVPPGQSIQHTCPACGQTNTLTSNEAWC